MSNDDAPPPTTTPPSDPFGDLLSPEAQAQLTRLLAGTPVEEKGPTYIGVPSDYTARVTRPPGSARLFPGAPAGVQDSFVDRAPLYQSGAEFGNFTTYAPYVITALQGDLVAGGLLSDKVITANGAFGTWGPADVGAMKSLMGTANRNGVTWRDVLNSRIAEQLQNGGDSGGIAQIVVSNPDDLKAVFTQVAQKRTGGNFLSDDDLTAMVEAYQKIQRTRGQGGVDIPSAQTFASQQVDIRDPGGASANRFAQMADAMTRLIGQT